MEEHIVQQGDGTASEASDDGMRIVSWNITQGGGRQVEKQVHHLTENNPAVIGLQEYNRSDSRSISEDIDSHDAILERKGYHVRTTFDSPDNGNVANGAVHTGLLIASRWPISEQGVIGIDYSMSSRELEEVISEFPQFTRVERDYTPDRSSILVARILRPSRPFYFYNVYLPHGDGSREEDKRNHAKRLVAIYALKRHLYLMSKKSTIVCGDFNTMLEPHGDIAEIGPALGDVRILTDEFESERRRAKKNDRWMRREHAILRSILADFGDAFEMTRPSPDVREYSITRPPYMTIVNKLREGELKVREHRKRLDHVIVSRDYQVISCVYRHDVRKIILNGDDGRKEGNQRRTLSDHAMVEVVVGTPTLPEFDTSR